MKMAGTLVLLMLLTGCATHLTESGRRIRVINSADYAQLKNCERLERVRGESVSFITNGEYGVIYATNDARNRAGSIPHADTLEIINDEPQRLGGEVSGIVYNCSTPKTVSVQPAPSAPLQRKETAGKSVPAQRAIINDSNLIFERAKKCQIKGGVWVNDACVIQID